MEGLATRPCKTLAVEHVGVLRRAYLYWLLKRLKKIDVWSGCRTWALLMTKNFTTTQGKRILIHLQALTLTSPIYTNRWGPSCFPKTSKVSNQIQLFTLKPPLFPASPWVEECRLNVPNLFNRSVQMLVDILAPKITFYHGPSCYIPMLIGKPKLQTIMNTPSFRPCNWITNTVHPPDFSILNAFQTGSEKLRFEMSGLWEMLWTNEPWVFGEIFLNNV
jgi:hypothetical protein